MPAKTLYDEEGNQVEVPDVDELQQKLAQKEKSEEELNTRLKEMEQEINPNWKEARKKIQELESKVKSNPDKGVEPISENISSDDIRKLAREESRRVTLENQVSDMLEQMPESKRDQVKGYFDKLSAGEELNQDKIVDLMTTAANAAGVINTARQPRRSAAVMGGAPRFKNPEDERFSETERGQEAARFLNLGFMRAQDKNKK